MRSMGWRCGVEHVKCWGLQAAHLVISCPPNPHSSMKLETCFLKKTQVSSMDFCYLVFQEEKKKTAFKLMRKKRSALDKMAFFIGTTGVLLGPRDGSCTCLLWHKRDAKLSKIPKHEIMHIIFQRGLYSGTF